MTNDATPSTSRPLVSPEPLMQMIQGLQVTAILQAGVQLGLLIRLLMARTGQARSRPRLVPTSAERASFSTR